MPEESHSYAQALSYFIYCDNNYTSIGFVNSLEDVALNYEGTIETEADVLSFCRRTHLHFAILAGSGNLALAKKLKRISPDLLLISTDSYRSNEHFVDYNIDLKDEVSLKIAVLSIIESFGRKTVEILSSIPYSARLKAASLTEREIGILKKICQGISIANIAKERNVRPNTISQALREIRNKINVESREELIVLAFRSGFVSQLVDNL